MLSVKMLCRGKGTDLGIQLFQIQDLSIFAYLNLFDSAYF